MVKSRLRPWQLAVTLIGFCLIAIVVARLFRGRVNPSPDDMMTFLPKREKANYVYVDVKALRDSGLLDRIAGSTVAEERDYKAFVGDTGFDYRTDLDGAVVESDGDQQFAVVAGHFDWPAITTYVTNHGGTCRGGFCRIPASRPNLTVSFYPIQPRMLALAVAKDEWAASTIKPKSQPKPEQGSLSKDPVWMLMPGSSFQDVSTMPLGTRQFAKTLNGSEKVMLSLTPQKERFELTLDVTCKSSEDAVVLRSQLEAITALLKRIIEKEGQKPNMADLSGVLTSGTFQRVDRHVLGKWPMDRAFLETIGGS